MNYIDIIILIPILFFAIRGLKCGLIKELTGIASIALGIVLAIKFAKTFSTILENFNITDSVYIPLIAFATIFIIVVILTVFISKLVCKFIKVVKLDWLNKFGGMLFSVLKTILIISAILYVSNEILYVVYGELPQILQNSSLYEPISSVIDILFPYIKEIRSSELLDF